VVMSILDRVETLLQSIAKSDKLQQFHQLCIRLHM
jgi:hypothetical protein